MNDVSNKPKKCRHGTHGDAKRLWRFGKTLTFRARIVEAGR